MSKIPKISASYRYTQGDCWYLALILHRLYGYSLHAFGIEGRREPKIYYHAFVLLDTIDGERRYLDVNGISTFFEIESLYRPRTSDLSSKAFIRECQVSDFRRFSAPLRTLVFPDNHLYVYRVAHRVVRKYVKGFAE